ncbi:hypothetical protein J2S43_003640 [Catenuloplanes nepalensis]|uniref:Uncharacterized protein n=1 Tax=Catenuloplanes nepalensis TaxID=587533 RepID=A0ABT9MUJ7_9ACTN|nr:hypothetical protein [Catenuloplanes nepalensis]MDP9795128.1 hypothetical protein [Catenuloplanes nepalensis]
MFTLLTPALDRLYEAFGRVPRPESVQHCECCFDAEEEAALLAPVPLRELPGKALHPYAMNVMTTVGAAADLRYFLPRMLEVNLAGDGVVDPEWLLIAVRRASWTTWPAAEQDALRAFLRTLWTATLHGHELEVDALLCGIGHAEGDLTPYLEEWQAALSSTPAAEGLAELGCQNGRLTNPFWDERPAQRAQVEAWLAGDALRRDVRDALYAAGPDDDLREALTEIDLSLS